MKQTNLTVIPLNRNILVVIYGPPGQKKPQFVLKKDFRAETFVPDPEPVTTQISSMELNLDDNLWAAFQAACTEFEISTDDCIHAFLRFIIKPDVRDIVKELLYDGGEN